MQVNQSSSISQNMAAVSQELANSEQPLSGLKLKLGPPEQNL